MKYRLIALLLLAVSLPAFSESESARSMNPHQLRLGWGDQHFEHVVWHATPKPLNTLPETYRSDYNENYRYTQHWSLEYQYRLNSWFSYGGMIDGSGVMWDVVTRNGKGVEQSRSNNHSLYNIVLMPTIYFTYLHHDYVSLHSGLGIGIDINGGTELDTKNRQTVCAPALNLTLIGVTACYRNWFASADIGAMAALTNGQTIYMLGSRLVSVAIGVTF